VIENGTQAAKSDGYATWRWTAVLAVHAAAWRLNRRARANHANYEAQTIALRRFRDG
jgi:hypothetical protein